MTEKEDVREAVDEGDGERGGRGGKEKRRERRRANENMGCQGCHLSVTYEIK